MACENEDRDLNKMQGFKDWIKMGHITYNVGPVRMTI